MAGNWITDINNNRIHSTALLDAGVILGSNNYIGPYCTIEGKVLIGDQNIFMSHCSIGTQAEHRTDLRYDHVKIGDGNIFREFVTVNASTDSTGTVIQDDCYLMAKSHVGHDVVLEDRVTLCTGSLIGGHSYIMQGATIGLGAAVHQRQYIGAYAMIGMNSVVPKNAVVKPGYKYAGNPIRELGLNRVGLDRANISEEERKRLELRYFSMPGRHYQV